MNSLSEPDPVIRWEGEETGGELDHVEAEIFAGLEVSSDGIALVWMLEDVFDPAASGDIEAVVVGGVD